MLLLKSQRFHSQGQRVQNQCVLMTFSRHHQQIRGKTSAAKPKRVMFQGYPRIVQHRRDPTWMTSLHLLGFWEQRSLRQSHKAYTGSTVFAFLSPVAQGDQGSTVLEFWQSCKRPCVRTDTAEYPRCKRGSPGATEHHITVPWNDAALQESVEFLETDATASQPHVAHCRGCATLSQHWHVRTWPSSKVGLRALRQRSLEWLGVRSCHYQGGATGASHDGQIAQKCTLEACGTPNTEFNEKTPRERTQSEILDEKEKERNFGSAVLDNSCFLVRTYRHEPMREHVKSAHHNSERASNPRTRSSVIQGCGTTLSFRSIFWDSCVPWRTRL